MQCKDDISFSMSLYKVNLAKILRDFSTGKALLVRWDTWNLARYLKECHTLSWIKKKKKRKLTDSTAKW